jgi:hypothetical protein
MANGGTLVRRDAVSALAELNTADIEAYPALLDGLNGLAEVLAENVGGGLDMSDLVRVTVPSGDVTDWKIPSTLGKDERVEEIQMIVVHWSPSRVYWPGTELSHEPPHCWSTDGIAPHPDGLYGDFGDYAGQNPIVDVIGRGQIRSCARCPMNAWGSNPKGGKGKACKEQRLLFGLRPGSMLPILVSVPPTSLKPVRNSILELSATYQCHISSLVLGFSLTTKSNGKNDYGEIKIRVVEVLDGARPRRLGGPEAGTAAALAREYSDAFGQLITPEVLAAAAAGDVDAPAGDDDSMPVGLGGEFADHDAAATP